MLKVCESGKESECESELVLKAICLNNGTTDEYSFYMLCCFVVFGRKPNSIDQFWIEQIMKSVDNWFLHFRETKLSRKKNKVVSLWYS